MTDTIKISRELMKLCAGLLEDHGEAENLAAAELRKALATPPADAADIGGQAGEEVEVVGIRVITDGFGSYIADTAMGIGAIYPGEVRQPLMTVAQHCRILAKHRQQAGKLVEALRGMLQLDEENHQRYSGDEDVCLEVRKAREALADWEKTNA